MAVAKVSEHDVDTLLDCGKLSVSGNHQWKRGDNKRWVKIILAVESEIRNPSLRISITVNLDEPLRRNFAFLWNNTIRVRGLCIEGSHTNRHGNTERWVRRTHKHKWTDKCQDRFAYTPTDITAGAVQGELEQFCRECGINCSATLGAVPQAQKDLIDEL